MDDYLDAIRHYRPTCIYGYASSLALLAAHARSRSKDLRLDGLKAVFCTGEPLYPQQKEIIEAVFGVPAAGEFGSRDSGFIAHASPEGQMLVNSESVLLEVLDPMGKPVAPGELGEAVITGLCSEAQPFIRYRTGDMLRLSDEPCRAGRGLHVLASVEGRTTDFVVRGDGTIMHALAVIYVARAVEGVGEFKIIQHSLQRLEVRVVPNARWNADAPQQIIQGMQARLGNDVEVVVTPLDEIAPEASGKHRYVISKVELPESLKEAAG
jgi:phenylacetate-CoA ligase